MREESAMMRDATVATSKDIKNGLAFQEVKLIRAFRRLTEAEKDAILSVISKQPQRRYRPFPGK